MIDRQDLQDEQDKGNKQAACISFL